jgi:hypothetical protein
LPPIRAQGREDKRSEGVGRPNPVLRWKIAPRRFYPEERQHMKKGLDSLQRLRGGGVCPRRRFMAGNRPSQRRTHHENLDRFNSRIGPDQRDGGECRCRRRRPCRRRGRRRPCRRPQLASQPLQLVGLAQPSPRPLLPQLASLVSGADSPLPLGGEGTGHDGRTMHLTHTERSIDQAPRREGPQR